MTRTNCLEYRPWDFARLSRLVGSLEQVAGLAFMADEDRKRIRDVAQYLEQYAQGVGANSERDERIKHRGRANRRRGAMI